MSVTRFVSILFPILSVLGGCGEDCAPADHDGISLLLAAAEHGNLPALDAQLADNPTPDVRDGCRWTPLMKAARNGRDAADWAREGGHGDLITLLTSGQAPSVNQVD